MLHEVELEAEEEARRTGTPLSRISMSIYTNESPDRRRYNAPRMNEVAVIFQGADGEPPYERDLMIYLRPDVLQANPTRSQRISILHPRLEPMTYPLLFPYGEAGWNPDIPLVDPDNRSKRSRVSQLAYFSYRLSIRDDFNPFLSAGKLTQQYIVDAYVKMEANRIHWVKENQQKLHAENYQGLMDYLHSTAAERGATVGRPVILPSSFIGSPRNMQQNYQDAMAIVRKYGKPDLFITVTCNPKWREITENLLPNQQAEHRPDLVSRVFHLKLKSILHDLSVNHVLGKIIAKIHVIEFQKRGLPHAHLLIILAGTSKPRDVEQLDKLISAEIPDINLYPRLHKIILKHNIHGPCGTANPQSPCMENGKCTKNFPKDFQQTTIVNLDGYPRYKRRDDGRSFLCRRVQVNNRSVVPFNPYLSLKYNCHINVESCATVKSVKYLFKYVYKGHDCANVQMTETNHITHDETKMFIDTRYVSAPEAVWRLFAKPMHEQSHTIVRLAVHLPNQQMIYFNPETTDEQSLFKDSTLMAWFKLNQTDSNAQQYRYIDIPEHYVFTGKNGWKTRQRGGDTVIGRMYTVSIAEGERYFLRLLLLHIPGATSFESLRMHDGILYDTFLEAAKANGLLHDDTVWDSTMSEAITFKMPKALRQMFAYICIFGDPINPKELWEKYLDSLIEDYVHKHSAHSNSCDACENFALRDVDEVLRMHGKNCADFGLRPPPTDLPSNPQDLFNATEEMQAAEELIATLNPEQAVVFDSVMQAIYHPITDDNCFFVDGPGGSGKTHLYNTLMSAIRGKGDVVIPTASTGIAANLLKGGRTYHSQFKLPIPLTDTSTSNLRTNSNDAKLIKDAKLLIIDEATMAPSHALNAIDKFLRNLMNNDSPCGGKIILLGGDFRQCLPVRRHASRAAIVQLSIKYSPLWQHFKIFKLGTNVRCVNPEYSQWLLDVGNGLVDSELGNDLIELPKEIVTENNLVEKTFGKVLSPSNVSDFATTAILCPTNDEVHKLNEEVLQLLEGDLHTFQSIDSIDTDSDQERANFPTEFLNSLNPSGMPPHKLNLKVGAIVMLLRNLNTKHGLCNGTRLLVTKLSSNVISAEILTGSARGQAAFIPRIELAPADPDMPFVLRRRQFPVKLAFCITINKSQGQTLQKVGIFLANPVFSHGQLYVALSRVRRPEDIAIQVISNKHQGHLLKESDKTFTKNIVFKEIF